MEKITMQDLEELVAKDEALTARMKEITGEGEELKEKIKAFAASMGYELVSGAQRGLTMEEMEKVSGGNRQYNCLHDFEFVKRVEGKLWGWNRIEKCRKCGYERCVWDD